MTQLPAVRGTAAPPPFAPGDMLRWVCTNNPFYAVSAALFLVGLRMSFGANGSEVESWALMSGLTGYALLLAVTGFLLVRVAGVWDDARTVLLLVVLMFLATSVTFDEVLVIDPGRGAVFFLAGLAIAVGVSEGLLRGIRLRLPPGFRLPYYLILALFFLYPLGLSPLVKSAGEGANEPLLWGLFGFSSVAGVVFLTLLPAVRRGPGYVRDNGSPWPWPLYPWVLFGLLAAAVPARAFLLCWSMHLTDAAAKDQLIFGPYFVVPFGFAVTILLLELGLVSGRRGVTRLALCVPLALIAVAMTGHRPEPLYREFLGTFGGRLGASPAFLTAVAAAGFYGYAAVRRVSSAVDGLTVAAAVLAVVDPHTLGLTDLVKPQPLPLLAAAALQMGLGVVRRESWRCMVAAGGLVAVVVQGIPDGAGRGPVGFHLVLVMLFGLGAVLDDPISRFLRFFGPCLALAACLGVVSGDVQAPAGTPNWVLDLYPLAMAAVVALYGYFLRFRFPLAVAGVIALVWSSAAGFRGYVAVRARVAGLDYLSVSLAFFGVAVLVSLWKSGGLRHRLRLPGPARTEASPAAGPGPNDRLGSE